MTRYSYGWRPASVDERDYRFRVAAPYAGAFVDLSAGFPEAPYDQGQLGSCVSNGTAAALDFTRVRQGLTPLKRPARLFIYFYGRHDGGYPIDQDTGLEVRDGLKVVGTHGAPPETDYPYDIAKFTAKPTAKADADAALDEAVKYGQVQPGDIDATIAAGYPVVQGFTVYESFESDETAQTGVVPMPQPGEQQLGGHCTVIVSTPKDGKDIPGGVPGVKYRRHLNSWGPGWGDGGFYWAPVELTTKYASDFWALTTVSDPNTPQPPEPPQPPLPNALVVAAQKLAGDQGVASFLAAHHSGLTKHVAGLVQAVVTAAQGKAA